MDNQVEILVKLINQEKTFMAATATPFDRWVRNALALRELLKRRGIA